MSKYRDAMEACMKAHLKPPLPGPVVDLGGKKYHAWMASIIGPNFETWDMQAGKDVARQVDAMAMRDVGDATVGSMVSTSAFEHIERPWSAAAEMARVTRPRGLVFVAVPFEFVYHPCPEDYWRFTPSALRVLFGRYYAEIACDWISPLAAFYYGRRLPVAEDTTSVVKVALGIPGLVTEEELAFLATAAMQAPAGGEIVELGTYLGRTCSVLAHAAARRGALPWTIDDYSYKSPCDPVRVRKHLAAFGLAAHVLKADSRAVPEEIKQVAFLFVDSLHIATHFTAEMAAWLPYIVPGGIICCHDYVGTKWGQMQAVIDKHFRNANTAWQYLGQARSMVAFKRL